MESLLTTEEVADFLRVDIVTVRRLVNRGELPAYRIANEYRFTRADLEEFMKRQRVSTKEEAKKVLELAVDEARLLGHQYIGTEHLLLGILREGDGLAVGVLESLGVDLEKLRRETIQMLKHTDALRTEALPEDTKHNVEGNDH